MNKFLFITVIFFSILGLSQVHAISVSNNGAGSQNSITIKDGSSTSIQQGSSLQIQNNVNANSNTGNNSANGNNGNTTIKTGDATSIVGVTNNGNTNTVVSTPCCTTPANTKPTATPKLGSPTATPTQGAGDPGNDDKKDGNSENKSGDNGSGSAQKQGEILGLANTASNDLPTQAFTTLGVLCLTLGTVLLTKKSSIN